MFLIENLSLEEDEEEDDDENNGNLEEIAAAKLVIRPDVVDVEKAGDDAVLLHLDLLEINILCAVKE